MLQGSFWKDRFGWEDTQIDFFQRTHELMKQAGALSADGEWLDIDRYNEFILAHLDKLQATAEATLSEDDINKYSCNSEDLLMERLESLDSMAIEPLVMIDPENESEPDQLEIAEDTLDFNKMILQESKIICQKLFDHYVKAQELRLDFATNYLKTFNEKKDVSSKPEENTPETDTNRGANDEK